MAQKLGKLKQAVADLKAQKRLNAAAKVAAEHAATALRDINTHLQAAITTNDMGPVKAVQVELAAAVAELDAPAL